MVHLSHLSNGGHYILTSYVVGCKELQQHPAHSKTALLFDRLFLNKNWWWGELSIRHLYEIISQQLVKERLMSMAVSSSHPSIWGVDGGYILRCQCNRFF